MDDVVDAAPTPRARALDRLLLPVIKIKSSASSKQLEQKLNYLWTAAHALLATSPALAHATAAAILETARQQRAQLPPSVLDYLCPQCGGLAVPSVSSTVRVVPVTSSAPANRKLVRQQQRNRRNGGAASVRTERLQNVVESTCHRCGYVNKRHGASVVYKPKTKKIKTPKPKKQKSTGTKRPLETAEETEPKRAKSELEKPAPAVAPPPPPPPPVSVFAKPASPPRRLLDSKKKKKKKPAASAATAQVKSGLDAFLQNLRK